MDHRPSHEHSQITNFGLRLKLFSDIASVAWAGCLITNLNLSRYLISFPFRSSFQTPKLILRITNLQRNTSTPQRTTGSISPTTSLYFHKQTTIASLRWLPTMNSMGFPGNTTWRCRVRLRHPYPEGLPS